MKSSAPIESVDLTNDGDDDGAIVSSGSDAKSGQGNQSVVLSSHSTGPSVLHHPAILQKLLEMQEQDQLAEIEAKEFAARKERIKKNFQLRADLIKAAAQITQTSDATPSFLPTPLFAAIFSSSPSSSSSTSMSTLSSSISTEAASISAPTPLVSRKRLRRIVESKSDTGNDASKRKRTVREEFAPAAESMPESELTPAPISPSASAFISASVSTSISAVMSSPASISELAPSESTSSSAVVTSQTTSSALELMSAPIYSSSTSELAPSESTSSSAVVTSQTISSAPELMSAPVYYSLASTTVASKVMPMPIPACSATIVTPKDTLTIKFSGDWNQSEVGSKHPAILRIKAAENAIAKGKWQFGIKIFCTQTYASFKSGCTNDGSDPFPCNKPIFLLRKSEEKSNESKKYSEGFWEQAFELGDDYNPDSISLQSKEKLSLKWIKNAKNIGYFRIIAGYEYEINIKFSGKALENFTKLHQNYNFFRSISSFPEKLGSVVVGEYKEVSVSFSNDQPSRHLVRTPALLPTSSSSTLLPPTLPLPIVSSRFDHNPVHLAATPLSLSMSVSAASLAASLPPIPPLPTASSGSDHKPAHLAATPLSSSTSSSAASSASLLFAPESRSESELISALALMSASTSESASSSAVVTSQTTSSALELMSAPVYSSAPTSAFSSMAVLASTSIPALTSSIPALAMTSASTSTTLASEVISIPTYSSTVATSTSRTLTFKFKADWDHSELGTKCTPAVLHFKMAAHAKADALWQFGIPIFCSRSENGFRNPRAITKSFLSSESVFLLKRNDEESKEYSKVIRDVKFGVLDRSCHPDNIYLRCAPNTKIKTGVKWIKRKERINRKKPKPGLDATPFLDTSHFRILQNMEYEIGIEFSGAALGNYTELYKKNKFFKSISSFPGKKGEVDVVGEYNEIPVSFPEEVIGGQADHKSGQSAGLPTSSSAASLQLRPPISLSSSIPRIELPTDMCDRRHFIQNLDSNDQKLFNASSIGLVPRTPTGSLAPTTPTVYQNLFNPNSMYKPTERIDWVDDDTLDVDDDTLDLDLTLGNNVELNFPPSTSSCSSTTVTAGTQSSSVTLISQNLGLFSSSAASSSTSVTSSSTNTAAFPSTSSTLGFNPPKPTS